MKWHNTLRGKTRNAGRDNEEEKFGKCEEWRSERALLVIVTWVAELTSLPLPLLSAQHQQHHNKKQISTVYNSQKYLMDIFLHFLKQDDTSNNESRNQHPCRCAPHKTPTTQQTNKWVLFPFYNTTAKDTKKYKWILFTFHETIWLSVKE